MEKPPKCTVLRLKFQNGLGMAGARDPPLGGGVPPPRPTPISASRLPMIRLCLYRDFLGNPLSAFDVDNCHTLQDINYFLF